MSKRSRTYTHIVSGLMLCSTFLSVIIPTSNALANNNVQNHINTKTESVGQGSSASKTSLNQTAGFSSGQSNMNDPADMGLASNGVQSSANSFANQNINSSASSNTFSSALNSTSTDKAKSANSSSSQSQSSKRRKHRKADGLARKPVGQVTFNYLYGNKRVGEKTDTLHVGQSFNTSRIPSQLKRYYQAVNGVSFKLESPQQISANVNVKSVGDNHQKNTDSQADNKKPVSQAEIANEEKKIYTPLPSRQYTENRTHVVNPMLRPNNAPHYKSASQFKQEVPMTTKTTPRDLKHIKPFKDFSMSVLRYKPYMDKVCQHYHMTQYETLLLAIMQCESGGRGSDVMQSSESLGLKPNSLSPSKSIEQGVRYMASIVKKAKEMDHAEQTNPKVQKKDYHYYANDNRLLAQTYNYGGNFMDFVAKQKQGYSLQVSMKYSRNVIAPRLGNHNGSTYDYDNPISRMYHKTFLYTNGGNFFYGDLVEQYAVSGYMHTILDRLIKYAGQKYVFGGRNPKEGFDCSGLTSYGFGLLGVHLPAYTVTQWNETKPVKGGLNNAKPGDLIFFKGTYGSPNFISHVGFIIDRHTMFASDSDGVGFHNLDNSYWHKHFAGIRRVPQANKLNEKANQLMNAKVRQAIQDMK